MPLTIENIWRVSHALLCLVSLAAIRRCEIVSFIDLLRCSICYIVTVYCQLWMFALEATFLFIVFVVFCWNTLDSPHYIIRRMKCRLTQPFLSGFVDGYRARIYKYFAQIFNSTFYYIHKVCRRERRWQAQHYQSDENGFWICSVLHQPTSIKCLYIFPVLHCCVSILSNECKHWYISGITPCPMALHIAGLGSHSVHIQLCF